MKSDLFYIYILTNKRHTVYYIGITNDLVRRLEEHKQKLIKGFTSRYNIDELVYYEALQSPIEAIEREKQIKKWRRQKKLWLIKRMNPHLKNLNREL